MDSSVWGKKSKEKKSVPACNFYRETGLYHKTTGPPKYLQWVAEEKLIDKNHEEFTCKLPDGTRSTFLMVFSPDGTMVASTHGNHNVYITYLTNGRNVKTLSGHPRTPWCIAFHPSSNQILASGCLGGQVRVWDLHGGSEIWVVESQTVIASLAFHPTDRVLVIASYNEIHFWDWSQDKPFAKCSTANEREKVRYVSFDKLGHRLITGIANAPRLQSQWDRVAAPQPPPQIRQAEHERRITICYRYMVEQYEQLVQRYYSLSRQGSADQRRNANNRNSQPVTMDRGTDPMEPPPVRTETRCSFCRGDVSGNNGSGTIRGDDGQRPSTSSDSSTPTSEINPTVRPASVNLRNASTQHRGTDEASASRSSSQFLSSHPVLEGVSSVSSNSNTSRSEDLTRQEAIRNARDFNSSIRASYLFNRITRLRDQVETGRDLLLRNAENLARRNLSSLMQPRMSPSSPEYLQGFEDIPPSLYESLPPLSPLPPPSPEETPEDLSIAPPLPAEDPPAPPTPPPLDDPLTPPPPPPPPLEDPVTPPQPPPPPPEDPPTPPPPPPPDDPDHSATLPIPPPPPRPPPTFGFFTRLSAFLLRGQLPPTDVARTTASENSTDSTEGTSNSTERKSNYQHINGNRSVKTNNPENAAQSSTSDTGNTPLSTDCSCPDSTSSTSTTTATTTTTTATAAATVLLSLLSSDCRCPESTSSTSTTSATTTTTPTATSGLNKEPPLSSSSSSSINRQSTPRAFRDSGSNTENYESNSSDSASGRVLRRNAESSSAIARLRAQFRRLQSAYNTRDRELMLLREAEERAERRLISRLTALLERSPWINSNNSGPGENSNRPSSAPVTSPLFISQPSSSSTSNPTAARASSSTGDGPSSVPTSMASVRCGLHFLTRHIENLSSQVRVDLERGQANHIRTLWHDLHNQICALSLALRAASAPVEGNSQENNTTNSDPAASSGGNESFPGAARLSSPAANLTALRTPSNNRAEESTSEASTSGTSSVTEEDDDESDVSPRNWFWLRRQSRRPRPHLRIPNAASKRARIDFRFRMGRGGTSRPDNYYSRLRLYDLLGPSDGSNDDDDDDDEDVENERDEDEETVDNAAGVQNVSRSSPNSSNSEGPPNRGIKRKSSRILTRSNITNQQASTAPSPSTSASPDLYYVPARARLNPRVRAFLSLRSQRNAQRQWHHPGYRSQWARDSHLAASESTGDGPSTSRQNNREDTPHREAIRRRARHVLLLMVDSITQFFENDTFTSGSNENLNERTSSLISLLELALELTDLLLTQLDSSRRRRHNYWQTRVDQDYLRTRSEEDRRMRGGINPRRQLSPVMLAMQEQERWDRWISAYTRMFQNNGSGYSRDDHSVRSNSQPLPSSTPVFRISRISATNLYTPLWSLYDSPSSTANNANNSGNNSSTHRTEIRLPVLRVNDGPVPPDEVTVNHINNRLGGRATSPRGSSPPLFYPPLFRPRLLHPRYLGPYYLDDNSTASEDSSQQENRGGGSSSPGDRPGIERFDREFFLMRGHPTAVLMGDSPMIPHHRIQAWDFTKFTLPEISNAGKNIVVEECKIHNDASVDLSQDGKILVTLLPSGRLSITTMLGVYSLEWDTLGQILYTTSFEQSAVSVSLSPTTRHLIVGLASRRLPFFHTDRQTIAQIFRLEGGRPGCESESPSKGKLVLVRELDISRESTDVTSLNCIRWAPTPGEGFVYGTNSGKLKVLR